MTEHQQLLDDVANLHQMRPTPENRLIAQMLVSIKYTKAAQPCEGNYVLEQYTQAQFDQLEDFLISFQV